MKKIIILISILLACTTWPAFGEATGDLQVTVQPDKIQMGATYNGREVTVTGDLPAGAVAYIRVTGHTEASKLKKKGRALGLLWMNQGAVEISNVPSVFLFYMPGGNQPAGRAGSTAPIAQELGLGSVRIEADIASESGAADTLFDEFVKLKKKSGLYGTFPNAVGMSKAGNGFHCTLAFPSVLPMGTYRVEVFAVKDGLVVSHATREIEAEEVGMPAFISALAFRHGTLYGVLSVLVAVIAGLMTGVLFRGGDGAH